MTLNSKGITPIIAVILLLMMTIAIAGLAYTWLQRTQATIQSSTENTTTALLGGLKVNLKVEGYNTTCAARDVNSPASTNVSIRIYGRNAGTEPAHNVLVYVDDALMNATANSSLNPGVTTNWHFATDNCSVWVNKTRVIRLSSDESTSEKSFTIGCTQYFKNSVETAGGVC